MKQISVLAAFVAALAFLSSLSAQDETKPAEEKKVEAPAKPKGPILPSEDVVKAGLVFRGRVQDIRSEGATKEVVVATADPQKYQDFLMWDQKAQLGVAKSKTLQDRNNSVAKYRADYAKKLADIFGGENKSVLVTETMRIRTSFPPTLVDADGTPKKISASELSKYKSLRLPGYAANLDSLRVGQIVDVTIPKPAAAPKPAPTAAKKKVDFIGVDPNLNVGNVPRVEALMIYVVVDPR